MLKNAFVTFILFFSNCFILHSLEHKNQMKYAFFGNIFFNLLAYFLHNNLGCIWNGVSLWEKKKIEQLAINGLRSSLRSLEI